jgi:thioredoxin reductase/NAD-dependent dihydropyrimidine dehydrogenase PreA subunit
VTSSKRAPGPKARAGLGDETRSRGLFAGGVLGVGVLFAGLAALHGPATLASPGPVALPHRELGCRDCHGAAPASSSCAGCHGAHDSRRPAHRELARVGELRCGDCHAVHRGELGVRFEPNGKSTLFGPGFEASVASPLAFARAGSVTVPLVERRACARCHDLDAPADPAFACSHPFAGDVTTCFDEHRAPGGAREGRSERDAAVEAARAVAERAPVPRWWQAFSGEALLVSAALGSGLLVARRARSRWLVERVPARLLPVASAANPRRLPVIDAARCLGCHACVDACPYDVLEVRRYVAVVARPDACCGAGPCEARCPNGSLTLAAAGPLVEPPFAPNLELYERPGVFVAGDVTGGSLIRNALRQGVLVAEAVKERKGASPHPDAELDLVVIGAGPAGLAAALTARELGLSAVVLEQATLADSIRRFSRQKLVLDAGNEPGERLPLFIGDVPKEELVERWSYDVRRARLDLREGLRAVDLGPPDARGVRQVVVEDRQGRRTSVAGRAVLVAIGRRGAPRELDVPIEPAVLPRVHYELSDARAFAGTRIVVVGLGDVAMETALALAAQPGTCVTVVHRGEGFRRGKRRNIDALSSLVARGRVELVLSARVTRISSEGVAVGSARGERVLGFDAVFVAIGSLGTTELSKSAGVCVPS